MFNRSVNKVVLVGNLGKDPEMRYTQNGGAVANFSVATTESWKNKTTGEYDNKTEWHNIVVFGKFAELVGQYIKKGQKVYVEGKLQNSTWDKEDGTKGYKTEIIASDIQLLDSKQDGQSQGQSQPQPQQNNYQQQAPAPQHQPAPQMAPQQQAPRPTPTHAPQQTPAQKRAQQAPHPQGQPVNMDFDDDIPF